MNGVWTVGSVDGSAAVNPYGFGEVCGDRAAANGALVDSHLFLTRLVPHPESMLVWWNEREQLQNGRGCTMAQRAFAASLVSSGLRYLAPPWEGMPEPEELPASSIALISGAQRIAVPTTDYRNVERLMRRYEDDGDPLEIESRQTIGTAQFNFQLYVLRSRPPTREAMSTARPIRVSTMMGSSLELNRSGVMFRSSPAAWAYIGSTSLPAGCIEGGGWISADIQVTHGNVELGVLNREGKEFLASTLVAAGDDVQTVNLRLRSLAAAGDLILRNWDERSSSQGVLQAVRIVAEHGLTPACDPDPARTRALAQGRALSLETMARASEVVTSFTASASGVAFRSAPVAWGYIGRMPLEAGCIEGGGWLAADINVTHGIVGVGVLNRKGDDFLVRAPTSIGDEVQTVFLRLDSLASAGDLVLQNWDENSSAEGTLQSVRIAAEDLPTPPACTQR